MKYLLFILVCLSSCNFVKNAQSYVQKHCPETKIQDPLTGNIRVHYECDSLYVTDKLDKCSRIDICFDAKKGKISGDVVCDSLIDVAGILRKIMNK